jgi:hypothetical protein
MEPRGPGVTLEGIVEVREPLGNEVLVHLATALGPLISRFPGQSAPDVGSGVRLHFPHAKLRFFDPETEKAMAGAACAQAADPRHARGILGPRGP